jgi:hypothetical protein
MWKSIEPGTFADRVNIGSTTLKRLEMIQVDSAQLWAWHGVRNASKQPGLAETAY